MSKTNVLGLVLLSLSISCATVKPVIQKLEDCAKPVVQNSIVKVVPVVELILTAAADGDWMSLLMNLAEMWVGDGVGFVLCAVKDVQTHVRAQAAVGNAKMLVLPLTEKILRRAGEYIDLNLPKVPAK